MSKSAKDVLGQLAELEQAASGIGVTIRYEQLANGPVRAVHGSCRVRDENLVIIDSRLRPTERLDALAEELSRFDLEKVFLSPALRSYMGKRRLGGKDE